MEEKIIKRFKAKSDFHDMSFSIDLDGRIESNVGKEYQIQLMGLALIPCPCKGECVKTPCDKCYCSGHIKEVKYG